MTATKSKNKLINNFIKARIKTNITENRKLATVICILHAIGFPLIMALGIYTEYYYEKYRYNDYHASYPDTDLLIIAGALAGIAALLLGMVVAMNIFRYLYKKSCVDMNLSLPLTTKQRFFTDYLTGLAIYVIPALAAWIIGDLIGLMGLALELDEMSEILETINRCGLCVILAMILYYTLTVFCLVCCGNIVEALTTSFLINGVIPLFLLVFGICICSSDPFGLDSYMTMMEQICFTSPIGCTIFIAQLLESSDIAESPYFISWLISIIVYTALIITASYLLYKKRKAESVSKPYVYKLFYYAMTSAIMFIIIYTISEASDDFLGAIFIGAIVYFIFEVITKRGFKKFQYSVLRYVGTVAAVFIVAAISDVTDGFGVYKYVPSPAAVSKVSVNNNGYYFSMYDSDKLYSDKKVIKAVTEVQKYYIDQYDHPDKYDFNYKSSEEFSADVYRLNNSTEINITYYLKNGNIVTRNYDVLYEDFYKIMSAVMTADEYADSAEKALRNYYDSLDILPYIRIKEQKTNEEYQLNINKKEFEKFVTAYKTDLKNMTEDDYYSSQVIGTVAYELEIRDCFENTIAFINEYEPDFNYKGNNFKLSELDGNSLSIYKNIVPVDNILNYYSSHSVDYFRVSDRYITVNRNSNYQYSSYYDNESSVEYYIGSNYVNPDIEKLINVAQNVYDSKETGGAVMISGEWYYIPVEYKNLVEKVYNELKYSENNLSDAKYHVDKYGYITDSPHSDNAEEVDVLVDENGTEYHYYDDESLVFYDGNDVGVYYDMSQLPANMKYYSQRYGEVYYINENGDVELLQESSHLSPAQ